MGELETQCEQNNSVSQEDNDSSNLVYYLSHDSGKNDFIAWILDISEDEYEMGIAKLKKNNAAFNVLHTLISKIGKCTIVLEPCYVDRVYRDSYYFHYSGKHFDYERYCKRICLFDGWLEDKFFDMKSEQLNPKFIGSIVIRPIHGREIGRTLLNPKYFMKNNFGYMRLTDYDVTVYGKRLHVQAFPYSMQDGETTSCAEITILNLLDYFSQRYSEYHYLLPSSISKIAEQSSFERRIPTIGLSYELISKIFCEAGFYPRLYATKKMEKSKFQHILQYYIESGIPIALGLKVSNNAKHSVVVVGYLRSDKRKISEIQTCTFDSDTMDTVWTCDVADTVTDYCIMDDNVEPYSISECHRISEEEDGSLSALLMGKYEIEYMMVPLYKRMYLEAADAYDICLSLLANKAYSYFASDKALESLRKQYTDIDEIGSRDNPFVTRVFMSSSRSFRRHRDIQFNKDNHEIRDIYNVTAFPKFVWVCELSTKKMYMDGKILGEIIIDATSSADAKAESFIVIHYPGVVCYRMQDDLVKGVQPQFYELDDWRPFTCFDGNLASVRGGE